MAFVVIASFVFYGYDNPRFVLLLLASILFNYGLHKLSFKSESGRKICLIAGLVFNLGILAYFKYLHFIIRNINTIFGTDVVFSKIILPLGISFYTFQQLSFIVDCYRGECPRYGFWEYAMFVSFFPQLIAGPIVLHSEMVPQFRDETRWRVDWDRFYEGVQFFILGLAKKLLLADAIGRGVDWGYDNVLTVNWIGAVWTVLFYSAQIYFDFSGYCDMAIGIGRMFNLDICENFDSPYKSLSISEFWRRWHITLGRFFTKYLYIPLGGNRKGMARTCLNLFIVMAVSGLWHGASWTFVIWGILHGILIVIERLLGDRVNVIPKIIRQCFTYLYVSLAWIFFRAETFGQAKNMIMSCVWFQLQGVEAGLYGNVIGNSMLSAMMLSEDMVALITRILFFMFSALVMYLIFFRENVSQIVRKNHCTKGYLLVLAILLVCSLCAMSSEAKFLYFNF